MTKYIVTLFSALCLYPASGFAQPSTSAPKASQAINLEQTMPKVSLKNLPFPKLKESLLEYSTRRIEDLTKEKACIESANDHKELKACVALIRANHKKTTEAVNSTATKKP